jgi:CubicO group peptidase (beta-lactamase class C family)
MKSLLLLVALVFIFNISTFGQSLHKKAEKLISGKINEHKIPGLAYSILRNGKIVSEGYFGVANVEFNVPIKDNTIFHLASITKIFTSMVIMKLHEEKLLDIEDAVTIHIDHLPQSWNDVKIKHLLNHTSGIENHFRTKEWMQLRNDQQDILSLKDAIEFSANVPLKFMPGSQYSYSVTGYMVLGLLVEEITGSSIEVLAEDMIFSPLQMNQTIYGDYRAVIKNRNSQVYTFQNGPFETWNFTYGQSGTTAAGLNSTIHDLNKFFKALELGILINNENLKLMFAPTQLPDGSTIAYGLGWDIKERFGRKAYGHEGGGCCWIYYYPDDYLTFIILSNLSGSKADEMIDELAGLILKPK